MTVLPSGNNGAVFILYHDDEGAFGQGQFPQGFAFPFMGLVNGNFVESQVFPIFEFMPCQNQQVSCQQDSGAIRHQRNIVSQDQRHQQFRRQRDIPQGMAYPWMCGAYGNLGKGDVTFCLIVIEGAADIGFLVDHVQFMCHRCQQSALQGNGKEYNAEHQVKQVVFHRRAAEHCLNGKHDGSGTAESRPGN